VRNILIRPQIALLAILSTFSVISFAAQQSTPAASQQIPDAPAPQPGSSVRTNPDESGIYHVGDSVKAPTLVSSVEPEYSAEARKHRTSADIAVEFIVDPDGKTHDFRVAKSEGWPHDNQKDMSAIRSLESRAMECVRRYRFKPATLDGKPVPCWMKVEVAFRML
jgi:TonB family C-terminal domain